MPRKVACARGATQALLTKHLAQADANQASDKVAVLVILRDGVDLVHGDELGHARAHPACDVGDDSLHAGRVQQLQL